MPLYCYRCTACDHEFRALQDLDDPPPECPKCEGACKCVIGRTSFALKGGGWFEDGYSDRYPGNKTEGT